MPGKTFAPLTQSIPLSSAEESHGLRRESRPKRVAFLLAINKQGASNSARPASAPCRSGELGGLLLMQDK